MNWRWKSRIQNAVASLPMSNAIYYAIQRTTGSLRPGRHNPLEWFKAAVNLLTWANSTGQTISGKRFLEVGTGRRLDIPTALWLSGAGKIVTVDLNRYLSGALLAESNEYVRQHRDETLKLFGEQAQTPQFQERFQQLLNFSGDLDAFLKMTNIEYLAPMDATALPVPDHSFDFHISYTVLQHIPGDVILKLLAEARRILVPQGLLIHLIDLSDMFSHDDKSITEINFLQFSEKEWEKLAGNKFMYHNRLRVYDYLELFRRAGMKVLKQKQTTDERALRILKNGDFQLDHHFQAARPEELAVGRLRVLGSFDDG